MADFYYRVKDACMSGDRIHKGDKVLIRESQDVSPHDISAIIAGADPTKLTLCRVKTMMDGTFALMSSNPESKTEFRKEICIIGKVVRIITGHEKAARQI